MTRRSPSGEHQHDAGGRHVEHLDASVGEQRQQIDDVEVVDERVGQLDECADEQRFVLHQRTSRLDLGGPGQSTSDRPSDCMALRHERDVGPDSQAFLQESVPRSMALLSKRSRRATTSLATSSSRRSLLNANARIRIKGLTDAHAELDRDHARCLVHDRTEVSADLQLGGHGPGRRVGLHGEHRPRGNVGHHERVGVLVVGERRRADRCTDSAHPAG